jgi:NAD(P)H-hydrate epimerase
MQWPTPLSRNKPGVHKNVFGHVLILAGSARTLGAAALSGLAAMRSGAGLVTIGTPRGLNIALQKKISPVIMTMPLAQTKEQSLSTKAFAAIKKSIATFDALAIGPGLSRHPDTQRFIRKVIAEIDKPMVIDADGLNALEGHLDVLTKTKSLKILTPHPGEMSRMTGVKKGALEKDRKKYAREFAKKYRCILVLKGHQSIVASSRGQIYVNKTGNAGMATAGTGDVLTGIMAALLGQGVPGFEAARCGVYLHGKAGDLAAKAGSKAGMIATDIVDAIPGVLKSA